MFFTVRVLCSVGKDRTPRSFPAELLSHWLAPSMSLSRGNLSSLTAGVGISLYYELPDSFSSVHEVPLNGRKNICYVNQTFQLCVICKLAEGAPCLIIQIINKDSNCSGDNIHPWGIILANGLHEPPATHHNHFSPLVCENMSDSSVSFQTISLFTYMSYTLVMCPWGCSGYSLKTFEKTR